MNEMTDERIREIAETYSLPSPYESKRMAREMIALREVEKAARRAPDFILNFVERETLRNALSALSQARGG